MKDASSLTYTLYTSNSYSPPLVLPWGIHRFEVIRVAVAVGRCLTVDGVGAMRTRNRCQIERLDMIEFLTSLPRYSQRRSQCLPLRRRCLLLLVLTLAGVHPQLCSSSLMPIDIAIAHRHCRCSPLSVLIVVGVELHVVDA
jgi:hypothetical protein